MINIIYKCFNLSLKANKNLSGLFLMGILSLLSISSFAQTDTEFWFSIPELNRYHQDGNVGSPCNDGTPTSFRITTLDNAAKVTISMPANASFTPLVINIPKNYTEKVDLGNYISDQKIDELSSMENRLAWTKSSTGASEPKKYINRNNKGIKIESDSLITVYYEIGAINNKELLTLKGKNALGEKFFVPFQDAYDIHGGYNFTRRPYGSFDIVATHNNTEVEITVPESIFIHGNSSGPAYLNAGTHWFYLDKGETAIITPFQNRADEYKTSFTNKLKGSMVKVIQNEADITKTVAVITKEDMVYSPGSVDYVADQLIPITHIGTSYAVVRGYAQNNPSSTSYEHFYVVGTEAGTSVTVEFSDASPSLSFTLGAGTQQKVQIPFAAEVATVESTNPVYVFHQSGVGNQFAGAIIPTISVCTGNFVSAFNRTMGVGEYSECPLRPSTSQLANFNFYLNILVYEGAEDGFRLLKEGVDVTATELPTLVFKDLPGTTEPYTRYKYARVEANSLTKNTAYRLVNDKNVFHLGVINGAGNGVTSGNADAFYGYFSDFNEVIPRVSEGYADDDTYVGCYGDDVPLIAKGGRTFKWTPTTFLDNPASATPTAINVTKSITYTANISGACALNKDVDFQITVSDPVWPSFITDVTSGCAPLKIKFTNTSTGHKPDLTQWDLNNDGDFKDFFWWTDTDPGTPTDPIDKNDPPNIGNALGLESEIVEDGDGSFFAWFDNNTTEPIDYEVRMIITDPSKLCPKELIKTIIVYPRITASFTSPSIISSPNCHPHTAVFTSSVTGQVDKYYWEFGDNNTSYATNPTNEYLNKTDNQKTFYPKLTVTDKWNQCTAEDVSTIKVEPFYAAGFTVEKTEGCSPLINTTATIKNTSEGPPSLIYFWELKDPDGTIVTSTSEDPPTEVYELTNTKDDNTEVIYTLSLTVSYGGCDPDTKSVSLTVYPNPTATVDITTPGAPDINCSPLQIGLKATTIGNTNSYEWQVNGVSRLSNPEPIKNPPDDFNDNLLLYNYSNTPKTNNVRYKATNNWGCTFESSPEVVYVQPYIHSEIVLDPEEICPNPDGTFEVKILDAAIWGNGNYEWSVNNIPQGPGNDISSPYSFDYNDPNLIKEADGRAFIEIKLEVNNFAGCTETSTEIITVNPWVSVDFNAYFDKNDLSTVITPGSTGEPLCPPQTIDFISSTTNTTSFYWEFGNLKGSNEENPSLDLKNSDSNPLNLHVTLTARNVYGCKGTATKTYTIQPEIIATFDIESLAGCSPFTLNVTAENNGTSYDWVFNGATVSNNLKPNFAPVINQTGSTLVEKIRLVASRGACSVINEDISVTIYPEVEAKWDFAKPPSTNYCAPVIDATFTNKSDLYALGSPAVTNVQWQVFDGGTMVTSDNEPNFTPTLPNTSHIAQKIYDIKLTATSKDNCVGIHEDEIRVNPVPLAKFNAKITEQCTPMEIAIDDQSKTITDTDYTWDWDGGDYANTSGQNYNVTYSNTTVNDENKTITLNLENEYGCTDTQDYLITVLPQVYAEIGTFSPTQICGSETITFSNISHGGTLNYKWNFNGDIINPDQSDLYYTSNKTTVPHTFANNTLAPKDLTVRLTATNAIGCKDNDEVSVVVYPKVTAAQSFTLGNLCNGKTEVFLSNASSNKNITGTDRVTTNQWRFTTGVTTTTFTNEGSQSLTNSDANDYITYNLNFLTQTVWNYNANPEHTCADNVDGQDVVVYPKLNPVYSTPPSVCSGINGTELTFTKNTTSSTGGYIADVTLDWNFGDGNTKTSNFEDVSHTFINIGDEPFDKDVTVIATQTATGCKSPLTIPVTVYPYVKASQSITIGDICGGEVDITLANNSSNTSVNDATNTWQWTFTPDDNLNGNTKIFTSPVSASLTNTGKITPVTYSLEFYAQTEWTDGRICKNTITGNPVTVYPTLNPIYNAPPAVCSGLTWAELVFVKNAASSGGNVGDVSIQWDFSDGNTRTTGFNPNVTKLFTNLSDEDFITTTKIFATQTATGCTANGEIDVRVHPKVESIFTFELGDVCTYPLPVTFTNASKYHKNQTGVNTTFHWEYGYNWEGVIQEEIRTSGAGHTYNFYSTEPNETVDYNITLTIAQQHTNLGKTCSHNSSHTITVYPEQVANFNLPVVEGCNPLTVEFKNLSTGVLPAKGGKFAWTFGDGTGSSILAPSNKVYSHTNREQSIDYPIELTTTNPLGCKKTTTSSIEVYPLVVSSFDIGQLAGCTPLNVEVNNTSVSSAYKYEWLFDNGNSGTSNVPQPGTIQFINPLGASDALEVQQPVLHLKTLLDITKYPVGGGCAKEHSKTVDVYPHVYPSFNATLEGCHPLDNVEFTNTSNVIGGTDKGTYTWVFGNGIQSNTISPKQTYKNADFEQNKTFDGKLTAESSHGCADSIDFQVTVMPKPKARLEMSDYMNCSPFELGITNLSVGKGKETTLAFTYNFGDGSDEHSTFSSSYFTNEYRNLNEEIEPYTLSLLVETEDGCTDETSQTIHVYPEVTPIFDTHDGIYKQCNPFEVQFTNSSKNAYSYFWEFDNGSTSQSDAPRYRFVNDGITDRIYNVKLTAMSEYDCEDETTLPITVFAAPIVDFVIMPSHQVFPDNGTLPTFKFKNQSRPKGIPASWPHAWTFGDGNASSSMDETVSHTYENWGKRDDDFRYEVTLGISNEKCSDLVSQKLTLLPPEPKAEFDASLYRDCSPLVVKFYNGSKFYFTENGITAFEWRIDNEDPPFSTEFEPTHTFTEPGYYNVGLTVFGDGGEKHFFKTFRVYENPVAMFEAMPERVTLPNAKVHFYNLSERADTSSWDFGDNYKSTDWDPVHIYTEMGEYRVTLTAISINDDDSECIDIYSKFPAVWVLGSGKIRFPNAFVPSKLGPSDGTYDAIDYENKVFHPVAEGVIEYRLLIFNRWGEQIFESKDINIGWDGYFKGKLASQGVYVWRAIGRFANGDLFDERGNITLLR